MNTKIFEKIKVGAVELDNRIVMAPMTRNRAGEGNVPHDLNAEYYRQRASAGLIITEASQISPQGVGYPLTPGIHSKEQIEGWKKVTDAVHSDGGHIFLQLWHVGRISHPSLQEKGALPVSPSAIKPAGDAFTFDGPQPFVTPRELSTSEVKEIVKDYAKAAVNSIEAGFDGVEIHAANGYLIDQFLRDGTNKRNDEYGGSLENRLRFLDEVVKGVTEAVGADRTGVRISPENSFNDIKDSDPQKTFNKVAELLSKYNLAYLHTIEGDFATGEIHINYSEIKEKFKGLYMVNAGYTLERATESIEKGKTDLVSFGAPFISNPDLVERFKNNLPLAEADQNTYYGGGKEGYTDYPVYEHAKV